MKDIIGHDKQKKYFKRLVSQGELSHAYLFTGSDMIGKKFFATRLYELLNDRELKAGDPDLLLVGPSFEGDQEGEEIKSSAISISSIRQIKSFLSLRPHTGPHKLIIIDDAHLMTGEAANALLKALEEPTRSSILILISSRPAFLPQTIYSRTQEVKFQSLSEEEIATELSKSKLSAEDREFITKISMGRIGLVKHLTEKENLKLAKSAVDDLRKLIKQLLEEKMLFAQKLTAKKDYSPKVGYWLDWVYANLQKSPNNWKMVKGLISLNTTISQPGLNHRLALENFLINL